jgi:nicotinamide-nucleotide amidase
MPTDAITLLATLVGNALLEQKQVLATAESCTGGGIGEAVTRITGSSAWYDRGFITYSNLAKAEMLGIAAASSADFRAVSEETARAMATGALAHSHATLALAVTGVAGPSGGSASTPVGTVCFAWAVRDGEVAVERRQFDGDREAVRRQTILHALQGLLRLMDGAL